MGVTSGVRVPDGADKNVKLWLERISDGMKLRRREVDDWKKNEDKAYKRKDDSVSDTPDELAINKVGSYIEKRMASLAFRNPRVKCVPKRSDAWESIPVPLFDKENGPVMEPIMGPGGMPMIDPMTGQPAMRQATKPVARYKILEATLNQIVGHPNFDFSGEIRRFIRAALIGMGCAKVGYTADFEYVEEDLPEIPADQIAMIDPEWLQKNYIYEDGVPLISNGVLVPKDSVPIEEQWFFQHVSYKKMIFDPDGENRFTDHNWVACEYDLPVEVVKKDKRLKNRSGIRATARRDADGSMDFEADWDLPPGMPQSRSRKFKSETEIVKLFEIWDFVERRWYIIADGHGKFLLNKEFPAGVDRSTGPWIFYRPTERIDEWYPNPPVSDLRNIAEAYDKFNQQALREARKSSEITLVREELFDEYDTEDFKSPEDEVIKVPRFENMPLGDYVLKVPRGGVNPGTLAIKNDLSGDFRETSGAPGEANGIAASNTATQVKALTAYDTLREDYQRGILRLALVDAMRKMKDSVQADMTTQQFVTMNGPDGMVMATDVDYEMIQCDCDVDIDIMDLAPLDDGKQRSDFVQAATIASQAPWMVGDPETAKAFFDLFGVSNPILANGIAQGAQMQMQMLAAQAQAKKNPTGPAQDEADAISKQGAMQ